MKCIHKYGEYRRVIFTKCYGGQGRIVKTCSKCGEYKGIPQELESAIQAVINK